MTSSNTLASSSAISPATIIGSFSSTSVTNLTLMTTPASMQMSYDQIILENTRCLTNNIALQARRDANELNVPADDLLIPVPPKPIGTTIQQWISAFAQFSPHSQAQDTAVLSAITPKSIPRPNVAPVSKGLDLPTISAPTALYKTCSI
ncbi:hypothetical protein CY34DRAFT_18342 [Suillus luteus UH-Slu-Lm8-n1]|uniref:Uncharacterized protein n=1 Tax=Suillus luteus UH-Slu-Lm8-n1 TaxID=930992 RepID=A0A0D0AN95_9AGAM|nr:hypothetical protein CY34DRAFT_18342 [Suillus luteus UH-Slu-Lm8-n1]